MFNNLITFFRARPGSGRVFLVVATTVSAFVLGVAAGNYFSMPKLYESAARIRLLPDAKSTGTVAEPEAAHEYDSFAIPTECEVLRSAMILARVIDIVRSSHTQGTGQLDTRQEPDIPRRIALLKKRVQVHQVLSTNLVEVRVASEDCNEAARIANVLVESYCEYERDLLKRVPPLVSGVLNAVVLESASPASRPQPREMARLARDAVGAILLGLAAGLAIVLLSFRRKAPLVATGVLPSLFVIVLSVVLGVSALKPSVNLAVATSSGLLIAFLIGGLADWLLYVRQKHPRTPKTVPAVFMAMFLLVLGLSLLNIALSPVWYCANVRLRLWARSADGARRDFSPGSLAADESKLIEAVHDYICSEAMLDSMVAELDLGRLWADRDNHGMPLPRAWVREALRRQVQVRRVPGTYIMEVGVAGENAQQAASLANSLAEACRSHEINHGLTASQALRGIQLELLDHAGAVEDPPFHSKLERLCAYAYIGLFWAFAAGGSAGWVVSRLERRSRQSCQSRDAVRGSA
jgi:capsular polysaccharide biosynthesis protein